MTATNSVALRRLPLLLMVVLVGLNLRPFLTATGPLAGGIRADTGMTLQTMSLLTLVPMALMGVFAFAGPALEQRIGARRAMIAALAVMAAGSAARLFVSSAGQLVATAALIGVGVAIVQAVFPGILKRHFPGALAVVMGLYSATLMGGGALGARLSPVIAALGGGWRIGLGWLVAPAAAAVLVAGVILPRDTQRRDTAPVRVGHLLRRPRTWLLMICFGLVNGGYSTVIAWLAPFYQEHGWSAGASGSLLAVMALAQGVAALVFPALARRGRDRRGWLWLTLALQAIGFLGLAGAPDLAPVLWAVAVGAGLGASFALTMIVALDHLAHLKPLLASAAGALAALMQGGGFLLAALAPWVTALLHERTGGFVAGWTMHFGIVVLVTALTARLAPHSYARALAA